MPRSSGTRCPSVPSHDGTGNPAPARSLDAAPGGNVRVAMGVRPMLVAMSAIAVLAAATAIAVAMGPVARLGAPVHRSRLSERLIGPPALVQQLGRDGCLAPHVSDCGPMTATGVDAAVLATDERSLYLMDWGHLVV